MWGKGSIRTKEKINVPRDKDKIYYVGSFTECYGLLFKFVKRVKQWYFIGAYDYRSKFQENQPTL